MATNYPLPTTASLQIQYVGKTLAELPTPSLIVDRAIVKRNCNAMLDVCKTLGVGFRAHVKSHKVCLPHPTTTYHTRRLTEQQTLELAKLQVAQEGAADFVVSTVVEAENLLPFVLECQAKGRASSVSEKLGYHGISSSRSLITHRYYTESPCRNPQFHDSWS